MSDTFNTLQQVFREVFEDDSLVITPNTSASDIDAWDSLMHVTLIVTVEKVFKTRFTSSQISRLETVGDLAALIEASGPRE